MHIHYFQHVPFEGLGSIEPHLIARGHTLSATRLYRGEPPPPPDGLDWLIVMGGPMGVHDQDAHPWLAAEKACIAECIDAGKIVLGICLGAQLVADVLGARVTANAHREIGWFPVTRDAGVTRHPIGGLFPESVAVFHWHGDTFDIPGGARCLGSSEACAHQGFVKGDRIVGLQFHLETTPESARTLIDHCRAELDGSRYVQGEEEMLRDPRRFERINELMGRLLDRLEQVPV